VAASFNKDIQYSPKTTEALFKFRISNNGENTIERITIKIYLK
jgi:hypothetical protein